MLRAKLKSIFQVLNLLIIFELCLGPLAYGQAQQDVSRKESMWTTGARYLGYFTNALTAGVSGYMQTANNGNINQYKESLRSHVSLAGQIVDPQQVPGVFRGCIVLPARPNSLSDGMKCSNTDHQQLAGGYAAALMELAEENLNELENYTTKGHETKTSQGLTCYDEAIKNANTQLLAREEQIRAYQKNLKKLLDDFQVKAEPIVATVKATSALLDGGKDFDKYHKDGKFSQLLLGNKDPNNTCGSLTDGAELQKLGKSGGLRSIQDNMYNKINDNSRGMSGQSLLTRSKQIEKEIDQLANNITSDMSNRNSISPDKDGVVYRGKLFPKKNPALAQILKNFESEQKSKQQKLMTQYNIAEVTSGSDSSNTLGRYLASVQKKDNPTSYKDLLKKLDQYELDQKNACLTGDYITKKMGGIEKFSRQFKNPRINLKGQDNAYAGIISRALASGGTIDDMIKAVEKEEAKERFKNYVFIPNQSIILENKTIPASVPMRASSYLSIFKDQCERKFNSRNPSNPSGYSQAQAVNELKKYSMEMTNLRKVAASSLNSTIKEELKTCNWDTTTGVASKSCDGALNINGQNFCLRTATKCASNMKACYSQVNSVFTAVKTEQYNATNAYNTEVKKLVKDLKSEMNALNMELERQSRSIDAQMDLGGIFRTPHLKFQLSKKSYLKGIDESLMMEDPEAYLNALVSDSNEMIKAMAKQRSEYFGSNGKGGSVAAQKATYLNNYKNNKSYWKGVIADCNQALNGVAEAQSQQAQQESEMNENLNRACGSLQAFNVDPDKVDTEELATELGKVIQLAAANPMNPNASAQDKAAIAQIRSWDSKCEISDDTLPLMKGEKSQYISAESFCNNSSAKELFESGEKTCNKYEELAKLDGKFCDEEKIKEAIDTQKICYDKPNFVKCTTENKDSVTEVTASNYSSFINKNLLKELGMSECSAKPNNYDDLLEKYEEQLKAYAAAYNCKKQRERAGQISVAVCNSVNANGVGKDIYGATFQQLGNVWGQSMGLSQ